MNFNMAGFFGFQSFRLQMYSFHTLTVIYCLISQSLIAVANDDPATNSTSSLPALPAENNTFFEDSPVLGGERRRGPRINLYPWMQLKSQANEVSNRQLTEPTKIQPNQAAETRSTSRDMLRNLKTQPRRGPRVFQRYENDVGTFNEMSNTDDSVSYPHQFDARSRDGNLRSLVHKARIHPKARRLPELPQQCQGCFQPYSNLNPVDKPFEEKYFAEIPAQVAMPLIERDTQNSEDLPRNAIEDEEFGESAMSLSGMSPAEDSDYSRQFATGSDQPINVFNIKGNSNHFYFLLPNGSASSAINALKAELETLGTQPMEQVCVEKCLQMKNSKHNNEIPYTNRGIHGQKMLSCDCKTHKVAAGSLPTFGQPEHGLQPTHHQLNTPVKLPENPKTEKQEPDVSAKDMELRLLPLLKLLQENQGTKTPEETTTTDTPQDETVTELEETEEEEGGDAKSSKEPPE